MGNLKSYAKPDVLVEYLVDGSNRRVAKKVNGVVVQRFVYQNQLQIAAELGESGNIVARFIYASKTNVPDFMIKSGVTYRIFSDNLGSPRLVVSTSGAIVQRIDYDEFGVVLNDTNPGFIPFGFAGGLYDVHSGLVRFGVRDYNPSLGRWLSKDPILFMGGSANLYSYVVNDPVNLIDPTGLSDLVFFNPQDPITAYDRNIPSIPGNFSIGAHGNPSVVGDQHGNVLNATQLANLIQRSPIYNGQNIQLNSCSTGVGQNSFAQQLANTLGKPVIAPTADLMMFPNGGTNVMGPGGWKTFAPTPVPYR